MTMAGKRAMITLQQRFPFFYRPILVHETDPAIQCSTIGERCIQTQNTFPET